MNNSKIKNEQYVTIQGWMVNELKLKGNDLIIYAIIYMFSQTENQKFTGSLQYLADWINSTKRNVKRNLESLIQRNLIEKNDVIINNVKFCEYRTLNDNGEYSLRQQGVVNMTTNIKEETKEENNTSLKVSMETYEEIVGYMNTVNEHRNFTIKIPFCFKATSKDTQKYINARLKDGYNIEEFKDVIYWGYFKFVENEFKTETEGTSVKYFRPSTLFSDKHFGEYLNEYKARTAK